MDGYSTVIGDSETQCQVVGLGKVYSPTGYANGNPKHYNYRDIQRACSAGPTDILLCHEGIQGELYGTKRCEARGIKKIVYATRPKVIFHGLYNYSRKYLTMEQIPTYSLAHGELLAFEWDGKKCFPLNGKENR